MNADKKMEVVEASSPKDLMYSVNMILGYRKLRVVSVEINSAKNVYVAVLVESKNSRSIYEDFSRNTDADF